jgi:hypothetical protein
LLLGVATRASSHPVGSNPISCSVAVFVVELSTPAECMENGRHFLKIIDNTN